MLDDAHNPGRVTRFPNLQSPARDSEPPRSPCEGRKSNLRATDWWAIFAIATACVGYVVIANRAGWL